MGFFSKKSGSTPTSPNPALSPKSPKLNSQSSRSAMNSPQTPSFPSRPAAQLPPPPNAQLDPEGYLTSLQAVRERSRLVFEKVRQGRGKCFSLDLAKRDDVIRYVVGIIKVSITIFRCGLTDREIMIPHIRVFHLMDDGNISMLGEDQDLNNSFNHGGIVSRP